MSEPACENKLLNYIQTVSHSGQPRRVKNTPILEVPRSTKSQAYQLLPQNLPETIASFLYIPGQQPANTRTKSHSILPNPIIRSLLPFGSHQCNCEKNALRLKSLIFSWREAHSSTGRLVTGSGDRLGSAQKTKLTITRSIFELEARNFACK